MCECVCCLLREHDLIVESSFTIVVSESVDVSFSTSVYVALESHGMSHVIHVPQKHTQTHIHFLFWLQVSQSILCFV